MSLVPGTRLGTYEILGPLGAGGMGEVYRAKDLRLEREIAIKVLPAEVASSPERLVRFEREARTLAGLNHPNIVTLHSVEDEDGIRFLTMELIEGRTLSSLVTTGGLSPTSILELAIPLTDALVAAHERGVIHRDLKPGNVMVTRDGRVKVLDFGLAKSTGREPAGAEASTKTVEASHSYAGHVVGTVPYMAPEQLRGETTGPSADLFSLGVILYELATGRRPFAGDSPAEIMSSILRDNPVPLSRVRSDIPDELERIVSHCLEKSPRERVQTALDVNSALRRIGKFQVRGEPRKAASYRVASIAVLPFVNRSRDADDEYFSDGLADELLNVLAKIRGLKVAARTSSSQFKRSTDSVATIGRKLNVATLLEGSVRKAGRRVRISVQLVKVADGYHIWSETYDRILDDIFAVQDDIAHSVVQGLRTTLLGEVPDSDAREQVKAEVARAGNGRGTDSEAYRLYLLARHLLDGYSREDLAKAIGYLKSAVARDPAFALAWAELARAYAAEAGLGSATETQGFERARDAVEHALALEPDLAEAHARMGQIRLLHDWDWRGAEASHRRALDLAPGSATVLQAAGLLAGTVGRLEEAVGLYRRALELDPLSSGCYHNLGTALHAAGRFTEAEAAFRNALELAPQKGGVRGPLSLTLLALGRADEALAEALAEPLEWSRLFSLAIVHHSMGHARESSDALRELTEKWGQDWACQVAVVHVVRGESDSAFEWLERAFAQRDPGLAEVKRYPWLRSLHGDARWDAFLKKMGLED